MSVNTPTGTYTFVGTKSSDDLMNLDQSAQTPHAPYEGFDAISVNGLEGSDTIEAADGNDLAAGDMVGAEWSLVDGEWVYDASQIVVSTYGEAHSFNDVIYTGMGNDVLLGNGGNDFLSAGAGDDIINAGRGDDRAFGGEGQDLVNLEAGNDYAEAGYGDDTVNGGTGDDVIYGDVAKDNVLAASNSDATTFQALAANGEWSIIDTDSTQEISQSANTVAGETYTISFDLAANFSGGYSAARVEVLWNGDVVDTVETTSGAYQTFEVDVIASDDAGELTFRAVAPSGTSSYNFDGPIISYDTEMQIGGETVSVAAFAPGQANLYQVINGHLNMFDTVAKEYTAIGEAPNFRINAVGFNTEDDLIYGVAKSNGTDSQGNAVSNTDIVMIDANGDTYRIGEGFYSDYVGDFDGQGNLWTFHTSLNRISKVDVNNRDADGNPSIDFFHLPSDLFGDRTYDLAYDAKNGNFLAVVAPKQNGGDGKLVTINFDGLEDGEMPTFSEITISSTLYGNEMVDGMAKGAFGALFFDGEGNLYYGLNRGDHDLDNSTGSQGGIFKVNVDWASGEAYAEFMSEAPSTGSNDGAVDPRSADAFGEVDSDAAVLIREPALTPTQGGNDDLRGGEGNDEIHGQGGSDELAGGEGNDLMFGDEGNDALNGGNGNDEMSGGTGDDKLRGEAGNDVLSGGEGKDYLSGGAGDDVISGGAAADKIVGGTGADIIEGGEGNDHIWGGAWSADGSADTFVFNTESGKDFVHDFEADHDVIDLSAFNTNLDDAVAASTDHGWATVIDLRDISGAAEENKIVLMHTDLGALDADNFIF